MDNSWVMLIPSNVYTRIVAEFSSTIKTQYKMTSANFSTANTSDAPAVFPFVFIQLLPDGAGFRDLEGTSINGGNFTFQVIVSDNQTQQRARNVMQEVIKIMTNMRFKPTIPSVETVDKTHQAVCRFNRVIGHGDKL